MEEAGGGWSCVNDDKLCFLPLPPLHLSLSPFFSFESALLSLYLYPYSTRTHLIFVRILLTPSPFSLSLSLLNPQKTHLLMHPNYTP